MTKKNATSAARPVMPILIVLALCLIAFQILPVDLWLQDRLFDPTRGAWLWNRSEPISRLLLYQGIKLGLTVFWLGTGIALTLTHRIPQLASYRRGLRIVFASLLLVPLATASLKAGTNIACPKDLSRYGGDVAYVGVLPLYATGQGPASRQMCFPASHAGSGFALLSLFFLFRSGINRRRAVYLALIVGSLGGAYKMAIGDHFLSHTVVALVIAWLVPNLVARADAWLCRNSPARDAPTRAAGTRIGLSTR